MRWARFTVFIFIAAILQAGLVDIIAITDAHIKPDLLLILLVFFAIYSNTTEAVIASFALGFAGDLIGLAMGTYMISFCLFGTLLAYVHRILAIKTMPYQALAIFVMGFLTSGLIHFLTFLKGQPCTYSLSAALFAVPLYSAIVGPFLFLPCAWCMRINTNRFGRV
ncbi:MAG: rod shape-determining protein MreD [Planctomycetota bacterium]|jgi:rod shape-determining protein MreD